MIPYSQINPIALSLGPIQIHWYGIMYLLALGQVILLGRYRARQAHAPVTQTQVIDCVFYGALGMVIGGRLGYMLFYNFPQLIDQPLSLVYIWQGGMSFHGGLVGVVLALLIFSRKHKIALTDLTDFFAPMVPLGLGFGRLGNFINGELWGKVTDSKLGMIFPHGGPLPRYPSQLFEALLEGIVFFACLWWLSAKPKPRMVISAAFLLLYASFRFFIEFYRQPDPQIGYLAWGWLTEGQLLCIPMFLLGIILLCLVKTRSQKGESGETISRNAQ